MLLQPFQKLISKNFRVVIPSKLVIYLAKNINVHSYSPAKVRIAAMATASCFLLKP